MLLLSELHGQEKPPEQGGRISHSVTNNNEWATCGGIYQQVCSPANWDASKGQSKGKTKKDLELNRYLDTIRTKICEIHNQLVMRDEMVNPDTLKKPSSASCKSRRCSVKRSES